MPYATQGQLIFTGGANPRNAPQLLADGEVASSTNIDFAFERGAAAVRQGSNYLGTFGSGPIERLFKHYANILGSSTLYEYSGGVLYRGTTAVATSSFTEAIGITQYKDGVYTVCQAGSLSTKDIAGTLTDWIKQVPASAPTVTISTLTPLSIVDTTSTATDVWIALEGTRTGTATDNGTATFTVAEDPYRITIKGNLLSTNLAINGTDNPIGDSAIDSTDIYFSDPNVVTNVSKDYSIGGTTFTDYWHTEMKVEQKTWADVMPDPQDLIDTLLASNTSGDATIDLSTREAMLSAARFFLRSPITRIAAARDTFNGWNVMRAAFQLVSHNPTPPGWEDIEAARIVIQCDGPQEVQVTNWQISGATTYPLNDAVVGIAYQETFAEIDSNDIKIGESAPSDVSERILIQNARTIVVGGTDPTGSHGCTHRILYRQGGYLRDFYAVASNALATATYTDAIDDITVLSNDEQLNHNIIGRADFPDNILYISEPHYSRIFLAHENYIRWSLPNLPDCFPTTSKSQVSHAGDEVKALVVWPPGLVIVNRDSVYEMDGTIFEPPGINWILRRTGARHGSKAPKTIVKTPYGLPLLDLDGLYMYIPGQGIDQELTWFMEKFGDAWKGTATTDPAYVNGQRIPAINKGQIHHSCAEYYNGRYYLAVPTGTSTYPDAVFVIDFTVRQAWLYTYPFTIASLLWDPADSRLNAGNGPLGTATSTTGTLYQIETGQADVLGTATTSGIPFRVLSKAWTAPQDVVLENISLEYKGGNATVSGIIDSTATTSYGVCTSAAKSWTIFPMSAAVGHFFQVAVAGTQTSGNQNALYQVEFDVITEPKRVRFFKTDYQNIGEGEMEWDYHTSDIEVIGTGSVFGTCFVDGVVVMTHTITGPTLGRVRSIASYPTEATGFTTVYGIVPHTLYTCDASCQFKLWTDFPEAHGRPEPPRITKWKETIPFPSAHNFRTWIAELNPLGTVTGTFQVDNTTIATATFTGSDHKIFNVGLDVGTATMTLNHGSSVEIFYNATTPFKHYRSSLESEPRPYTKRTWSVSYKKSGGASQLDLARFWSYDIDAGDSGTATITAIWDIDGSPFSTNTFTHTARAWRDVIPFPPGGRGYLFQLRLLSDVPIDVWKSNLDTQVEGVKGFVRKTYVGAPASVPGVLPGG